MPEEKPTTLIQSYMMECKQRILENLCFTELVYERINKKLKVSFTKEQIERLIDEILKKTPEKDFIKSGKNYYISDVGNKIRITINSNTCRVITADKLASQ